MTQTKKMPKRSASGSEGRRRKRRKRPSSADRSAQQKAPRVDATAVLDAIHPARFDAVHLPEPDLVFGDGKHEPDPKTGLALHKPYDWKLPGRKSSIRLGIIGTGRMVDAVNRWLDRCTRRVLPMRKTMQGTEVVQKAMDAVAYPPFPGLGEVFDAEFVVGENMDSELTQFEMEEMLSLPYFEQRVTQLVRLVVGKVKVLSEGMQAPDVIIVALPTEIRRKVTVPKHQRTRSKERWTLAHALQQAMQEDKASGQGRLFELSPEESAQVSALEEGAREAESEHSVFHHGLKAAVMPYAIPIQLAWQAALEGGPTVEDDATRAWNFWTGIYYKAGGIPWRVSGLDRGTCYVGIAFYRDRKDGTLRTSIAQAFSDRGEGIVLRSEPFEWDDTLRTKTPHMPKELARDLMTSVIRAYEGVHGQPPSRVVVHKRQRYFAEEREGLEEALRNANIRSHDLVAFGDRDIRFYRAGMEPVIRGTQITLTAENVLLYTRGYIPYTSEYPGMRVPRPIEIVEHYGSSSLKRLCEEILALTKLDWNSAVFAQKQPITTAFSEDVGQILAEIQPGVQPKTLYRFYM
jgi:hypothetical protein